MLPLLCSFTVYAFRLVLKYINWASFKTTLIKRIRDSWGPKMFPDSQKPEAATPSLADRKVMYLRQDSSLNINKTRTSSSEKSPLWGQAALPKGR